MRSIVVGDLGLTAYAPVLALQRELQNARTHGGAPDTLLLTEHEPVLTLGRGHPVPDLRVSSRELAALGIDIVQTERGGDITYHGPGQLVAYPIIDLRAWDLALTDYVAALETTVIRTLGVFGIAGETRQGARGVWVGDRKIASLGINVRRWVTMHGIALNVSPEMARFRLINACGMPDVEMTSMEAKAVHAPPMERVKAAFVEAFCQVFACCETPVSGGEVGPIVLPEIG